MTRQISGILFDKDGTLFDFARTWEAWASACLKRIGEKPQDAVRLGAAIGFDMDTGQFQPDSVVIAGTTRQIAMALLPHLPSHSLASLVNLLNDEAAQAPQSEAVPLVPLLETLRDRGLRLGVATNDAVAPAHAHLRAAGITDQFDFVAGFDSGYGGKPAPGQLLAFAEQMGLSPDVCVMVGDSLHDLRAGRAAGFGTVGVLTGMATRADLTDYADVILPDIGHLPGWLATA